MDFRWLDVLSFEGIVMPEMNYRMSIAAEAEAGRQARLALLLSLSGNTRGAVDARCCR